jgi:hypothetical protein
MNELRFERDNGLGTLHSLWYGRTAPPGPEADGYRQTWKELAGVRNSTGTTEAASASGVASSTRQQWQE